MVVLVVVTFVVVLVVVAFVVVVFKSLIDTTLKPGSKV